VPVEDETRRLPDVEQTLVSTSSSPEFVTPQESIATGTVVVTTNHPCRIRILSDGKEVVQAEIATAEKFENIPIGDILIQVAKDGHVWTIDRKLPLRLAERETLEINLQCIEH